MMAGAILISRMAEHLPFASFLAGAALTWLVPPAIECIK
jgi:hypothetical protein